MSNIVCSICGSTDVETVMWVNHKTGEPNGYFMTENIIFDSQYNFCCDCGINVALKVVAVENTVEKD